MSVIWELYPFLLLFLLIEGITLVKKGMIIFIGSGMLPVNQILPKGIGYKADPFAPAFSLADDPFIFTVDGLYYLKHELSRGLPYCGIEDYGFIDYHQCDRITRDEKKLLFDGSLLLNTQSSAIAQAMHDTLSKLSGASPETISSILRSSSSLNDVQMRLRKIRSASGLLSFPQTILFTLLYFTPLLWNFFLRERVFPTFIYVCLIVATWLSGTIIYAVSSRKLSGKIDWLNTIQLFVFPVSICRAIQYLTASALAGFSPLPVAAALFNRKLFTRFAKKRYTLLTASMEQDLPEKLRSGLEMKKVVFEEILKQQGIPLEALEVSLTTDDPNTICYCPLCFAEFRKHSAVCTSCNVATRPVSNLTPKGKKSDV